MRIKVKKKKNLKELFAKIKSKNADFMSFIIFTSKNDFIINNIAHYYNIL